MSRVTLLTLVILTFALIAAAPSGKSVDLSSYRLQMGPLRIKDVSDNASGLTYNSETKSLFLVLNSPQTVLELTEKGAVKRTITLAGFSDTEGITWVGTNGYAVVEEGRGTLCLFTISDDTRRVNRSESTVINLFKGGLGNLGLEGLTYDKTHGRFFTVQEKSPAVYAVKQPLTKDMSDVIIDAWDTAKNPITLRDLSGIYYHASSGNLLVLSHESHVLVEVSPAGREISRLALGKIPQPEGITMDEHGTLYICSEPNLLYVYRK